ncbi:hypothetical protein ACIGB6_14240 [Paeniglutamicibacter gangotriensis]
MPPTPSQAEELLPLVAVVALVEEKEDCRQWALALLPHLPTGREKI